MTAATSSLTSPGQIAANLPGILGFYPQDSLVIATFTRLGGDNFELGPVLRIDIDDLDHLPDLSRTIDDLDEDLVFGFLVTERTDEAVDAIIDALLLCVEEGPLTLDALWVVPEILTGEELILGFGPQWSLDSTWVHDRVAPVSSARAMEPLLAHGELPDLSREEAGEHFHPGNPHLSEEECGQLTRFALSHARQIPPGAYPEIIRDARLLIEEAQGATLGELLDDEEVILTVATLLGTLEMRDLLIEDLLDQPDAGAPLMLAVARTCRGLIRHNALALYALCSVAQGLSMRASHALQAALEEDPTHLLSRLLLAPAQAGAFEFMISSVREGSRIVRGQYGVGEAAA